MSINQNNLYSHSYFMNLALMQAKKNLGNTRTNPSVGCIITKNNCVIAAASTSIGGRPHAEVNAMNFSRNLLNKADLYVTLEPCSHYGQTPPCVKTIIKKKINRVFFSINDPDLRSFNKSFIILKKKGIKVKKGVLKKRIWSFYQSYIRYKKNSLPFVTSKLALSRDFYSINKKSKWITNDFSRGRVHLMRSTHDCILTSSKTISKDNPKLTCRIHGLYDRSPTRIILDNKLKINLNSKILKETKRHKTIIFYNENNLKKIKLLNRLKIKTYRIPITTDKNLDLKKSLLKAKKLGFSRIFLEAGLNLTYNFFKKNLINDFKLFVSKSRLGKNGTANAKKYLHLFLKNKKKYIEKVNLAGDTLISYKIK